MYSYSEKKPIPVCSRVRDLVLGSSPAKQSLVSDVCVLAISGFKEKGMNEVPIEVYRIECVQCERSPN